MHGVEKFDRKGPKQDSHDNVSSHATPNRQLSIIHAPKKIQGLALLIWPSAIWEYLRPVLSNQTRQVCLQGPEPRRHPRPFIGRLDRAPTHSANGKVKENNFLATLPNPSASKVSPKKKCSKNKAQM